MTVRPLSDSHLRGLSSPEVERRLAAVGPNEIAAPQRFRALRTLLALTANPLLLMLLAASVVSGVLGELLDAGIIASMALLSLLLDWTQVFRAERAASRLRGMVAPTARVWRDGQLRPVPVRMLVPGDLLEVRAGDLLPADAVLREAVTLAVDEAALTGESLPVDKTVGPGPSGQLFAGTSVVSGMGSAEVTATGGRTQFGAIARALVERAPPSEYETGVRQFGLLILRTVLGLVLFVFFVAALLRRDPLESFLFAVALAIGLTPEFLPMLMTVTLGQGALALARQNVIVKRLTAIEHLGSMDILCSDKTGTLTRGAAVLQEHVDPAGRESESVLRWACVNSSLEAGVRSPLDAAILDHDHPAVHAYVKRAELPLDFDRRRVSVLAESPNGVVVVTKGAPESVLPLCTRVELAGTTTPLLLARLREAQATYERLSRDGLHVLAVAWKAAPEDQRALDADDESDLTLAGFVAFLDPPDPSARETLARLRERGVRVKILTGDGELVTRTICRRVGIDAHRVTHGAELDAMPDEAVGPLAEETDIFVRVSPSQKNRLIRALKARGHSVGFVGDGINDAPSLHAADVGISVANGVDVAREAADIILLEKSLAAIERGVLQGRRSFGNITKCVLMETSSNFGNMLSMAAAAAFLPFLPLLPAQILLNNFLYDLSQITIPTDNVDDEHLVRPRRWDAGLIRRFMFGLGPISSLYDFLTFGVLLAFQTSPAAFRTGWFVESLATQTLVIFVIRTAGNPLRRRPSKPLAASVAAIVVLGAALALSPAGRLLGFTDVPPLLLAVLALLTGAYLVMVQVTKRFFFARSTG